MCKFKLFIIALILNTMPLVLWSQANTLILNADLTADTISRHIYGNFSEHLGHCIYGGVWVGENSPIPNTRGIRNDVVAALKRLNIPNLRWPGGCFADEYHWMDGIGPRDKRPKMINTHWGGVVEDNSFGTHEFLDLCEQVGTEPYICGNLGSGSVEEMSKWVEYITFDGQSPMSELRKQNGREKPWKVKFWGVGNENWGCGGNMTAEFYADQYKRYATYTRNYGNNVLFKVAGGPNTDDYHWTETLMDNVPLHMMNGVSLHYYTVPNSWQKKGSSTQFTEDEYFTTIRKTLYMEELVTRHAAVMDQYDPQKRVGLIVDEWGTWYDVEPGTNPGFLFQQNTLRDALVAGINLNIFNNHCDRVKGANIAQMVNVLQAIIFTEGEKMVLTPTYYVFEMYKVHQDAALIPLTFKSPDYVLQGKAIPAVTASASRDKSGKIHVTFTNADPHQEIEINIEIRGAQAGKVTGTLLSARDLSAHNSFENAGTIKTVPWNNLKPNKNILTVKLPASSVSMLEIN
ncbi:MAG: alpha-N-arabinofuranosidase [Bacteroidales bacterium]|nr:alpha-N-arabinofuranosidase [Bacteroidales bacterium]